MMKDIAMLRMTLVALSMTFGLPAIAADPQPDMKPGAAEMKSRVPASPGAASREQPLPPASTMTKIPPTSVVGKDVVDSQGKKIGEISKIAGSQVIVSVGGFLGIGAHDVALNWKHLELMGRGLDAKVQTTLSEEELKHMPEYKEPAAQSRRPLGATPAPANGGGAGR